MLNVYEELGDTSRRLILGELRTGSKSVTEICEATNLKQPNVSNHLARMRVKGIVRASKVGRQVFYSLATTDIEAIVNGIFTEVGETPTHLDFGEMAKEYARAATQGDEAACLEIVEAAFRAHTPLVDIYQELLTPAMALVGTWWKVHAIDEAQEHMATAITERMMARVSSITGPMRRLGKVALLGCAPNAWHVLGLRMISDLLKLHGWKTLYLGPNVPERSFLATVTTHEPDLVLLSCGSAEGIDSTVSLVRRLSENRTRRLDYRIGVGGGAVYEHGEAFLTAGADFVARDIRSFATDQLPSLERTGSIPETDRADFVSDN